MGKKELKNAKENKKQLKKGKRRSFLTKFMFLIVLLILTPFIILFYIFKAIKKKAKYKKWEKEGKRGKILLMQSDISDIDIMEGYEFENYLATLFFYEGFSVDTTPKSKDYGADLVLIDKDEKIVVQAKRYNKKLGVKCVQEVVSAIKHYKATNGMVVTNSHFTNAAETLAKDNNIRLVDREELIEIYTVVQKKLNMEVKKGDLVLKKDENIEDKFPFMI